MKKRVVILSLENGFGGIESEVITLANSLVDLYDIELLFLNSFNNVEKINSKIKVEIHSKKLIGDAKFYKDFLANKDVIISTDKTFNKYILKYGRGKKIFWEHEDISQDSKYLEEISHFDTIVVPNKKLYASFSKVNDNVVVINNAIIISDKMSDLATNNIVFVGKLREEKRVDDLIDVISLVNKEIDVNLFIIGEGSKRSELETMMKNRELKNIHFLGSMNKENIEKVFLNSSLFVTCSERETFGLSILEAMSYGLPVVAFSDASTLKQIILDDINGYLIDNRDKVAMKNKIVELMNSRDIRQSFGNCAKENVLEYDINSLKREWIKII